MMEDTTERLQGVFVAGIPKKRFDIVIQNGRFVSVAESSQVHTGGEDLWISPGLIDLHTHLGWTDFDHEDQCKRSESERDALCAQAFASAVECGITTVRDAGGLSSADVGRIVQHGGRSPHVFPCGDMLGKADVRGMAYLESRVRAVLSTGAPWVKIFATGGMGSEPEHVLDPVFSRDEILCITRAVHAGNRRVMVHAWGGQALDWAIDAGVDSIEHGVYLTDAQADRLVREDISFVPTTAIYRIAADPHGALSLKSDFRDHAARAAEHHPRAVRAAKRAGVRIGMGTDFCSPALYGRHLEELDALVDCGLTWREAWLAATETAAVILGQKDRLGRIAEGLSADAILSRSDPCRASDVKTFRQNIVRVLQGQ